MRTPQVLATGGFAQVRSLLKTSLGVAIAMPGSSAGAKSPTDRERVGYREIWKAREVAVGGPEHSHTVKQANRGNPGIVHNRALQLRRPGDPFEGIEVAFTFGQESTGETVEQPSYGIQGYVYRSGVPENPRIRDDREKLVNAWPGYRHGFGSAHCVGQHLQGALMERHFGTMCIHQQVCVDGNHAPRSR